MKLKMRLLLFLLSVTGLTTCRSYDREDYYTSNPQPVGGKDIGLKTIYSWQFQTARALHTLQGSLLEVEEKCTSGEITDTVKCSNTRSRARSFLNRIPYDAILQQAFPEKNDGSNGFLVITPLSLDMTEDKTWMLFTLPTLTLLLGAPVGSTTCQIKLQADVVSANGLKQIKTYKTTSEAVAWMAFYWGYVDATSDGPAACSEALQQAILDVRNQIEKDHDLIQSGLR